MKQKSKTSGAGFWIAFWVAIYTPQLVLVGRNWKTIVATIPMWTAGLVGVLEVAACVAILAAIAAAFSFWIGQARLRRRDA